MLGLVGPARPAGGCAAFRVVELAPSARRAQPLPVMRRSDRFRRRPIAPLVAFVSFGLFVLGAAASGQQPVASPWAERAAAAQRSLVDGYWNERTDLFDLKRPADPDERQFHYWWQAHAIDVLVDGFERSGERAALERAERLWRGVQRRNGGPTNDYYDDMLWMAIALQRLERHVGSAGLRGSVETLWRDVRRGWNDEQGGGIAWRKTQLDYKNAPANAPAVIVGARLYEARHRRRDLEFALRVDDWLTRHLVDPDTGFVWDGVNRKGDGRTDKGWAFSYNQGVRIGAGLALFEATDDERHRAAAARTFEAARARLCDEQGVLRERGDGDGALFKGILVRYATDLALRPDVDVAAAARAFVLRQAEALWSHTEGDREHDDTALAFSSNWRDGSGRRDELAAQLSAVMLLECAARLERAR